MKIQISLFFSGLIICSSIVFAQDTSDVNTNIKEKREYQLIYKIDSNKLVITDSVLCSYSSYSEKGKLSEYIFYDFKDGSEQTKIIYKYDNTGRKTEEFRYSSSNLNKHKKYIYDSKGNLIEETRLKYDGSIVYRIVFSYDTSGRKTEERKSGGNDIVDKIDTYKYDEAGRLIELINLVPAISMKIIYKYQYDNKGNLITEKKFTGERLDYEYTSTFDEKNRKIKEIKTYPAGDNIYYVTYSYNINDSIIEETYFDKNDKLTNKKTFKYDNKNQKVEECNFSGNTLINKYTCTYNQFGDKLIESTYLSNDILSQTIEYVYNDKRKLIDRQVKEDGVSILMRETYYYNAGNNLTEEIKYDRNGNISEHLFYKYDKHSNIIESRRYLKEEKLKPESIIRNYYSYYNK
ncbi:MAG: hypothetical protein PHD97_01905 [Bacteroidales bacterium]|nr:hypothetical protein [Bacteroidales bacterium]